MKLKPNFERKTLVILGAGHDQLPMYQVAKEKGVRVIGVDQNPQACGAQFADQFIPISTRDWKAIIGALGDQGIHGVISPASDAAHETIYQLSHHYDLPWKPSLEAVEASVDKGVFLEGARRLGIKGPNYVKTASLQELVEQLPQLRFPLMVKPVDSSGSKGITYVEEREAIEGAFYHAKEFSWKGEVIAEEYIEGSHYSVEMFRSRGKTLLGVISQKVHTGVPSFITLQHLIPAPLGTELEERVYQCLDQLCDAFGVMDGPVNYDFILRDQELYLIEMGARLAGNGMPTLVQESFGINTYALALSLVLGEPQEVQERYVPRQFAALQVITGQQTGVLKEISGCHLVKEHPAYQDLQLFVQPGDRINAFAQSNHKLGYLIAAHPDRNQVEDLLRYAQGVIQIEVMEEENTHEKK